MQTLATTAPDPDAPIARRLVRQMALALAGTTGVLCILLVLADHAAWWRGLTAAALASVLSAAATLPPLIWGARRPTNQRVAAFFGAMGLRAVISLGACLFAIGAGGYPAAPTLLLMIVYYFAILAVETHFAARSLWNAGN